MMEKGADKQIEKVL